MLSVVYVVKQQAIMLSVAIKPMMMSVIRPFVVAPADGNQD
jgi:hypothetical protein